MQSAGMPELVSVTDIEYMHDRLALLQDSDGAADAFRKEMRDSHGDFYRRIDNTIHNVKHG